MRAYRLAKRTGIDDLAAVDLPALKPQRRQVLVKIAACSLNYRDLAIALGTYPMPVRENLIPLSDGAGEVTETGPDVTRWKAGDRVAGCFFPDWIGGPVTPRAIARGLGGNVDGVLAEYAVFEEDGVVRLPDHLSWEEGATLPCAALTAWNALAEHGRLAAGETVLVQGTGGVALFALQFARLMGAEVIVTSSSDEKLARARKLGAAHGVNYRTTPEWDKAVIDLTGGRGVDQVVEIGGPGTFARSLGALRPGGRISMIGVLAGPAEVNPRLILARRANVQGMTVGSAQLFEAMNRAIAAAKLRPVIDRVFAFDQVRDAYRHMQAAAHFGKIVVRVA